jgi:hypothetical protein
MASYTVLDPNVTANGIRSRRAIPTPESRGLAPSHGGDYRHAVVYFFLARGRYRS